MKQRSGRSRTDVSRPLQMLLDTLISENDIEAGPRIFALAIAVQRENHVLQTRRGPTILTACWSCLSASQWENSWHMGGRTNP